MVDRAWTSTTFTILFAFRIIVDSVKDCYEALGIVHAMWKPMPGTVQGLHRHAQGQHVPVPAHDGDPAKRRAGGDPDPHAKMHETSEFGVAAHWMYKEHTSPGGVSKTDLEKFPWLRQIMEWQSELKDPGEFLEAVKVDFFEEEIFVFTPKGDVIQLPFGRPPWTSPSPSTPRSA